MTNPLHSLFIEDRVLFIHTPQDLPEDVEAAIINEIAVFNRTKTIMYSQCEGGVAVIKRLMVQLSKVEDFAQSNMQLSKDFKRFTDSVKAIEKAPLYINDRQLSVAELVDNIKQVVSSTENERKRYRIVIIDDFMSLKGMIQTGIIDRAAASKLKGTLKLLATEFSVSFVIMSRKPLKETFPINALQKAFVTINGKEYIVEIIMTD
ncbi:DnaB-like helicase C-terminal domain-containing protein [Phocaeicola plebeius]|nr:DnaB-like helicase C-terminal domain-containing protein [Phocaeicola plebeius]